MVYLLPPSRTALLVSCVGVLVWIGIGGRDKYSRNCKKDTYKRNSTLYIVKFVLVFQSMQDLYSSVLNITPPCFMLKVMTPNPECATIDTPIVDALHTMHDGKFLHLPVVDRGNIV